MIYKAAFCLMLYVAAVSLLLSASGVRADLIGFPDARDPVTIAVAGVGVAAVVAVSIIALRRSKKKQTGKDAAK
jgi:hypothetical protein